MCGSTKTNLFSRGDVNERRLMFMVLHCCLRTLSCITDLVGSAMRQMSYSIKNTKRGPNLKTRRRQNKIKRQQADQLKRSQFFKNIGPGGINWLKSVFGFATLKHVYIGELERRAKEKKK